MYRIIIVDDEPLIRSGLKNMIEWEVYGIEIAGEAEDGMKAYSLIRSQRPDIALIDISMPNVSGLELIELCSHLEHPPRFIILSGYNDFEYVRTAIRYGAVNYLLKPVDQEELTNTIQSTVKLLDDDRTKALHFQEGMQALKNDTLIRLLNHRIESRELREKCQLLGLSFRCSSMRVGLLQPAAGQTELSGQSVGISDLELCQELCRGVCPCYTAIDAAGGIIFIFKDHSHELAGADYARLLEDCAQALSEKTQGSFFTAFGPNASSAGELQLSYCSALQTIEKKQAFKKVFQKDLSQRAENGDGPELSLSSGQIVQYLTESNIPELRQAVRACFHHISGSGSADSLELVKYSFIELIIEVTQKLKSSALTDSVISALKQRAFSLISSADSFSALEENMLACFTALAEQLRESSHPEYSFLVRNAVNYVRENYRDCNLSLKTLASQMKVNATYLGRQFSLETKEYFSDYLNRIRVTQAIQLLNDTMWKTSRIAEEVGFANVSYFYTIFKKVTGKSPGDYRREL